MMIKKILYTVTGIVLGISTVITGNYGLSERNLSIYKDALGLQKDMDNIGYSQFELKDYPICFYDGNNDYVVRMDDGTAQVKKRKPVIPTFVGTAYPVNGHYEVIIPTIEKFSEMYSMFNTASNAAGMKKEVLTFDENEYGDREQIATIWHEGFHAYQMTNYIENLDKILENITLDESDTLETFIVSEVDANSEVVALYKQEMSLLKESVLCDSVDDITENILRYKELDDKRRCFLSKEVIAIEEYYERVEGTAYYVEALAYLNQYEAEAYKEKYIDTIDSYVDGAAKYYAMGMAKCIILDKLKSNWKENYDFAVSISDLLYGQLGD